MRQFWERGYRATSVDDLVRATGVKPGSLYAAFPGGKHALLMGSLDRYSKLVVPVKLGELEHPGASVAEVRAYFDGLVRDLLSPEGRQGCLLVNSAIENAAADPEVAAVVRGHLARLEMITKEESGRYRAKPVKVFGFEEIVEAHRAMEQGLAAGKMVVAVN